MQRNSSGRFRSKSGSNKNSSNRNAASVKVLQVTSARQLRAAERLLDSDAGSLVLIWSPTCPHCHTYMPLWNELTKMTNKATNMISVRSDVYPEMSLAASQPVSGVPTVLYINPQGEVQEIEDSRNKAVMTKLVTSPEIPATMAPPFAMMNTGENTSSSNVNMSAAVASGPVTVPGTRTMPSELMALPGSKGVSDLVVSEALEEKVPEQPVQQGGNLGSLVRTAGPAALLLGAYAAFGRTRSSGLPPARKSRRVRFSRRKQSKRSRRR